MDEVMSKAIAEPRKQVSEYAPKIVQIQIDPEKIGDVVGQRGKTINAIIDRTGVKIDIDRRRFRIHLRYRSGDDG